MKRLLTGLALLALGAGVSSVTSTARADVVGAAGAFTLTGSNGYRILVLADSRRADGRGEVILFVGRRQSGVSYFAPANVTDSHIEADLGGLGHIAVQFVPSGAVEEESACGGDPTQFEGGVYEGSIEFNGEQGYTRASATRVRVCTARTSPDAARRSALSAHEGRRIALGSRGALPPEINAWAISRH